MGCGLVFCLSVPAFSEPVNGASVLNDLSSKSFSKRQRAVGELIRDPQPNAETINILTKLLQDPAKEIRYLAIHGLRKIGPKASGVIPKLINMFFKEEHEFVKRDIPLALAKIGAEPLKYSNFS